MKQKDKNKRRGVRIIWFCTLFTIGFFVAPFVLVGSVHAFSVSPLRQTVVVEPGGRQTVRILVGNNSDNAIYVFGQIDAFKLEEKTGRPIFGADDKALGWIEIINKELYLLPGSGGEISFDINIPEDAEPGAHYLGLFALQKGGGASVSIGSRVGSLLFLYVAGEVREELTRVDFSSYKNIYIGLPIKLSITLKNNGTIHLIPQGEIRLENIWGDIVGRKQLNLYNRKVLSGNQWIGTYEFTDFERFGIGPFRASMYLRYGHRNKQQIIDSISFWYIPVWIVGFLLILFLFIMGILFVKKRNVVKHKYIG